VIFPRDPNFYLGLTRFSYNHKRKEIADDTENGNNRPKVELALNPRSKLTNSRKDKCYENETHTELTICTALREGSEVVLRDTGCTSADSGEWDPDRHQF